LAKVADMKVDVLKKSPTIESAKVRRLLDQPNR